MTGRLQRRYQKKCPHCGRHFSCDGSCGNKGMKEDFLACYCPKCYEEHLAVDESRPWRIKCSLLSDRAKQVASLALLKFELEG